MLLILSGDIETNQGPYNGSQYRIYIFHLNIWSIRNKIESLISLIADFDILCFTVSLRLRHFRSKAANLWF